MKSEFYSSLLILSGLFVLAGCSRSETSAPATSTSDQQSTNSKVVSAEATAKDAESAAKLATDKAEAEFKKKNPDDHGVQTTSIGGGTDADGSFKVKATVGGN